MLVSTSERAPLVLIGAPSSAGAYSRGQEDAPSALRNEGFVGKLVAAGVPVRDSGDLPLYRWKPDRRAPHAQNIQQVVDTARGVRDRVAASLAAGERVLVLGGDCTVGLGTLAGATRALDHPPSWIYFDAHADLNTTTSVKDGALDWTGMAHALALPDTLPELCALAASEPMVEPEQVTLFAHDLEEATPWEQAEIERLALRRVAAAEVERDPIAASRSTLAALKPAAAIVIHFDVDVVNFTDAPLSENTGRATGIRLDSALAALHVLMSDSRVAALTITELNPHHAAADDGLLLRFADRLAEAISGSRDV